MIHTHPRQAKHCDQCDAAFTPHSHSQRYCSERCRTIAKQRRGAYRDCGPARHSAAWDFWYYMNACVDEADRAFAAKCWKEAL